MLNLLFSNPIYFVIYAGCLLMSIAIHECAHALAADRLGDPTPRLQGRLTLNPKVHIDLMGMLFLFLIGFGWGKPVVFDPYNLQNPRRDAAWISIAGPASNFVLALILAIVLRLINLFVPSLLATIGLVIIYLIYINVVLGLFNLLPIHPMDGFKIVGGILSEEKAEEWNSLQKYGMIFLILLIFPIFGGRSMIDSIITPAVNILFNLLVPGGII